VGGGSERQEGEALPGREGNGIFREDRRVPSRVTAPEVATKYVVKGESSEVPHRALGKKSETGGDVRVGRGGGKHPPGTAITEKKDLGHPCKGVVEMGKGGSSFGKKRPNKVDKAAHWPSAALRD